MSTRLDIIAAKRRYEDHNGTHKCRSGLECSERQRLWREYMRTASNWGIEPGDEERQRRQSQQAA